MNKLNELNNCPFCGKDVAIIQDYETAVGGPDFKPTYESGYIAVCSAKVGGCGAGSGWTQTKGEAVQAWNLRSHQEEYEKLKGERDKFKKALITHSLKCKDIQAFLELSDDEFNQQALESEREGE